MDLRLAEGVVEHERGTAAVLRERAVGHQWDDVAGIERPRADVRRSTADIAGVSESSTIRKKIGSTLVPLAVIGQASSSKSTAPEQLRPVEHESYACVLGS